MPNLDPSGAKAEAYLLTDRTALASLRRELAKDTTDPNLYPMGLLNTGSIYERTGVVTPDMFDPMMASPRYNLDADYPGGGGAYYAFNPYSFYQEISADAKVSAAMEQRIATTIEREWVIEPGGTDDIDIQAADSMREHLEDGMSMEAPGAPGDPMVLDELSDFDSLQVALLDALGMGISAMEILWERDGRHSFPSQIKYKPQHRLNMYLGDRGWEPRLLTREHPNYGQALPQRKFIIYRHRPRFGPFGRGINYELGSLIYDKKDALKFNMVHAQRYAGPTVFIPVPANASDRAIERARQAAENMGQEAANTVPEGMMPVEIGGKSNGASGTYKDLLKYFDGAISQLILGQTGTMNQDSEGGSRAQDEVADIQTLRKSKQDSRLTCKALRRSLLRWDTQLNYPLAKIPKLRRLYPELEETQDEKAKAERDKIIVDFTGRQLSDEYLQERHQVEFAEVTGDDNKPIEYPSSTPNPKEESDPVKK